MAGRNVAGLPLTTLTGAWPGLSRGEELSISIATVEVEISGASQVLKKVLTSHFFLIPAGNRGRRPITSQGRGCGNGALHQTKMSKSSYSRWTMMPHMIGVRRMTSSEYDWRVSNYVIGI
jgi:hypothetical protein